MDSRRPKLDAFAEDAALGRLTIRMPPSTEVPSRKNVRKERRRVEMLHHSANTIRPYGGSVGRGARGSPSALRSNSKMASGLGTGRRACHGLKAERVDGASQLVPEDPLGERGEADVQYASVVGGQVSLDDREQVPVPRGVKRSISLLRRHARLNARARARASAPSGSSSRAVRRATRPAAAGCRARGAPVSRAARGRGTARAR